MYHFIFQARPKPSHPESTQSGGAWVSCWINNDTLEEAELLARRFITERHWVIIELDQVHTVTKESYGPDEVGYFEQAEIDGEVFVFHTWPVDAPDDR